MIPAQSVAGDAQSLAIELFRILRFALKESQTYGVSRKVLTNILQLFNT